MFKSIYLNSILFASFFGLFPSCSSDNNTSMGSTSVLETKTYSNLNAPETGGQGQPSGGPFTKFSFSQNAIVTDDSWDIAFRGTTILVNGGTLIGITSEPTRTGTGAVSVVINTLEAVITIPNAFVQDGLNTYAITAAGGGSAWYIYDRVTHIVSPIAGKVFVIKTHDGKYAKMEILNYYKDAPANPDINSLMRYYTFRFVYQPNGINF